jgi:hypothetical protein
MNNKKAIIVMGKITVNIIIAIIGVILINFFCVLLFDELEKSREDSTPIEVKCELESVTIQSEGLVCYKKNIRITPKSLIISLFISFLMILFFFNPYIIDTIFERYINLK